jgi:hypothetical protein
MSPLTLSGMGWAIHMSWSLQSCKRHHYETGRKIDKLLDGADRNTKVIENNTRIMKEVVYYLKWDAQKNRLDIPPYIEDIQ